ncbi:hypothetical protein BD410DRAFT_798313 [Rickenella mellea]|uniref:Uncharacterized protein n=1 Tax=Rickenella mellea TaxID=50990 RepID=A0A4R5XHB6_9AGAM|nr:hypothetical protein BD410DRAFT_798313 [Rickenella mellea]
MGWGGTRGAPLILGALFGRVARVRPPSASLRFGQWRRILQPVGLVVGVCGASAALLVVGCVAKRGRQLCVALRAVNTCCDCGSMDFWGTSSGCNTRRRVVDFLRRGHSLSWAVRRSRVDVVVKGRSGSLSRFERIWKWEWSPGVLPKTIQVAHALALIVLELELGGCCQAFSETPGRMAAGWETIVYDDANTTNIQLEAGDRDLKYKGFRSYAQTPTIHSVVDVKKLQDLNGG